MQKQGNSLSQLMESLQKEIETNLPSDDIVEVSQILEQSSPELSNLRRVVEDEDSESLGQLISADDDYASYSSPEHDIAEQLETGIIGEHIKTVFRGDDLSDLVEEAFGEEVDPEEIDDLT